MAYPYYNQFNNPNYPIMQQPQVQQQSQQTMQIQNGGFLSVPSEEVARSYPVAPGNSVTFKNENAPYIYTKTMGFSQLDRPIFEKFKLVKEEDAPHISSEDKNRSSGEMEEIKADINKIWAEIRELKENKEITEAADEQPI